MDLWLSVIDKKMAHPNEIQNTFVPSYLRVIILLLILSYLRSEHYDNDILYYYVMYE